MCSAPRVGAVVGGGFITARKVMLSLWEDCAIETLVYESTVQLLRPRVCNLLNALKDIDDPAKVAQG